MRVAALAALVLAGVVAGSTLALGGGPRNAYVVHGLVSDEQRRAPNVDRSLVNVWGQAGAPMAEQTSRLLRVRADDFEPVALLAFSLMIVARKDRAAKDLKEFIA